MDSKNTMEVLIGGKTYSLSGTESKDYLKKVAAYINQKLEECSRSSSYKKQSQDTKTILLALNIADDYFKARQKLLNSGQNMEEKDREIYDLKHELISAQNKLDDSEALIDQLTDDNRLLEKRLSDLEKELANMKKK